jgi:hypothetical protein
MIFGVVSNAEAVQAVVGSLEVGRRILLCLGGCWSLWWSGLLVSRSSEVVGVEDRVGEAEQVGVGDVVVVVGQAEVGTAVGKRMKRLIAGL